MDLHGGDIPEALVAFTIYEETGDAALDARSRAMAEAFGMPAMLAQPRGNSPISGTTYSTAARLGIPAMHGRGRRRRRLRSGRRRADVLGAENALRSPGRCRRHPPAAEAAFYRRFVWIRSVDAGFFKPAVQVGDTVAAGATMGTINDFHGRTLETVTADAAGRVLFLVVSAAVKGSGLICGIGAD